MADKEEPMKGYPLRQETTEQERYEKELLKGRYPESIAGDYNDDGSRAEKHNEKHKGKHHDHGHGVKGRMKYFWTDIVKPAFPEAITDIHIFGEALHVRTTTKKDMHNLEKWPEVAHVAEIRTGSDLCPQEQQFLHNRKEHVREHFAKYLGLDPAEVNHDDIPVIGLGGSGGGFRAMIGYIGYMQAMKKAGLWDLITYVSGVSGSCWSLGMYYTFGETNWDKIIEHCKIRLNPLHPMSGDAIRKLLTAPGGAHNTLGPLVEKHHSGLMIVPMDLYSVFITGYLFLQEDAELHPTDSDDKAQPKAVARYKWSKIDQYLNKGQEPLPIFTAIRHERPWRDWVDKEHPFTDTDPTAKEQQKASDAWFQWFEMTPYEVGCDELQTWCPTWGFGRPFEHGKSTMQLPEQSLSLLLGLCTGAPAGPLSSYLATVSRQLPPGFVGNSLHSIGHGITKLWGKKGTEEFENHHPLHASNEHNYMYHLSNPPAGQGYPPGLENSPRIHLIDSGMDNNCPTYVLLNPARQCDVIINMDASSDVQKDSFQERVDQIGSRRGLKFTRRNPVKPKEDPEDPDRFAGMYGQLYDGVLCERPQIVVDSYGATVTNPPAPVCHQECTMVYMPLLPNEKAVPGYDPSTAKFSGSYNLVWTPEQVEMLMKVSTQNTLDGEEAIKTAVRDAYERKKRLREEGRTGEAKLGERLAGVVLGGDAAADGHARAAGQGTAPGTGTAGSGKGGTTTAGTGAAVNSSAWEGAQEDAKRKPWEGTVADIDSNAKADVSGPPGDEGANVAPGAGGVHGASATPGRGNDGDDGASNAKTGNSGPTPVASAGTETHPGVHTGDSAPTIAAAGSDMTAHRS